MISLKNIQPLSNFLRNAKMRLVELKKTGQPAILTVNGEAEAVVLSAEAYQKLMDELDLYKTWNVSHQAALESLRTGGIKPDDFVRALKPVPESASIPAKEAFAELDRRFQQRRRKKAS